MKLAVSLVVLCLTIGMGTSSSGQTPRLKKVMRAKLNHSQRILEALVTSNWQQLDGESRELARVARDPAWSVLTMPEYVRHTAAFLRATDDRSKRRGGGTSTPPRSVSSHSRRAACPVIGI